MSDAGGRPIRVLHVEDEPDFADLASTMLEREEPAIEVRSAPDAEAGLDVLAETDVDCVVSDFDMPGTNGLELLATVRERHGDLPFILFTGKGSEEIASDAISAGVTDYIQKGGGSEGYAMLANRIVNAVERHRTERALREERRRFELVGRASADAFWDYDPGTGEVQRSEGYERIFGFDAAEVGDDLDWWVRQVHPDDRETVRRAIREAVENGEETMEIDYRVETPDGDVKDAYARAHVVRDEAGEPIRVVGAVTDVTDLKERERELERVRERLELVLEGTETGVWEWDPETDEVRWDGTVERLFGVDQGGFEGTFDAFYRRAHDDDAERLGAAIDRAVADGERFDEEFRIRREDGAIRWVRAEGVPPSASPEGTERFVGLIRDVTDRKERDRELRQYETIVESVPDGVFVLDEDGVIVAGNDAASRMLGFRREALVGTAFSELVEAGMVDTHVVDRYADAVRGLLTSSTDERARFEFEVRVDGEPRVFEVRLTLRPFEAAYRGTIGIVQDVTDRKEREARLRRSERRFEAVFDDPSTFIGLLDPDGTLVKANETALAFVDARLEEVTGQHFLDTPWWDDVPRGTRAQVEAGIERAADGEFRRFEATHTGSDGATVDVEGHIRPVTDASGDVVSLLVEGIDVTNRREQERTVRALLEATRQLVRADDPADVAEAVVRASTEILDQPSTVVRLRDGDALPPVAVSEQTREKLGPRPVYAVDEGLPGRVLAEGKPLILHGDEPDVGGPELHPSRLYLPIGEYGTVTIGSDEEEAFGESDLALTRMLANHAAVVLDRVESEQTLRRRERALTRQNGRLDRFARIVSHDLRNPLNVAQGGVDLIEKETGSERTEIVRSALRRMDEVIDDALSLARQGEAVVDPSPVDVEGTVAAAWGTVCTGEATLEVDGDPGTCLADESRFRQLLENLLSNAVEHAGPDVTVSVGVIEEAGKPVGLSVADDGPGIPASDRGDVFAFGWSRGEDGTGFGLAIVEDIAEAHGWSVRATESASGGARFEVTGVEFVDGPEPNDSVDE